MRIITGLKVPRKTLVNDLIAALVMASGTVPGSIANGVLAGTNPVYGVYSTIAGTAVGVVFTSDARITGPGKCFPGQTAIRRGANRGRGCRRTLDN